MFNFFIWQWSAGVETIVSVRGNVRAQDTYAILADNNVFAVEADEEEHDIGLSNNRFDIE